MDKTSPFSFGRQQGADRRFDNLASLQASQLLVGQRGKQRGGTYFLEFGRIHGLQKAEVLMNQFDGHGSFADPRSDPFGGAMTDIARYKDARNTRLEIKWIAIGGPSCR